MTATEPLDFLLVVPAFEESRRLPVFLASLAAALAARPYRAAILVVDDGSSAPERSALAAAHAELCGKFPNILSPLLLKKNVGKGGAIMAGWNSDDSARRLAFVDADGAISAGEVCRVFDRLIAEGGEVKSVFAARVKMLGHTVEQGWARHIVGRVYASLVGCLIDPRVYDTQCGFKVITRRAWESVRAVLQEKRFAFDVELSAALLFFGHPVEEVPIDWVDQPGSKISLPRDARRMVASLFRIRNRRSKWVR